MARYDVNCHRCERVMVIQLFGPNRDREWRLKNWIWTCDECKEAEKQEASEKAAKAAEEIGLPELEGTEKQIRWAEVLRVAKLKKIEEDEKRGLLKPREVRPGQQQAAKEVLAMIKGNKSARFWIDNREVAPVMILKSHLKLYRSEGERELERDVASEATVRPEKVVSETVAEIKHFPDRVEVYFPERRDDFWQLIKKELHYTWLEKCWVRKVGIFTGSPEDRAADVGHRILGAGFPIRIFDEDVRQQAIAGQFEAECGRWIARLTEGEHKDWFSIRWLEGDYYRAAKRLPASHYARPWIVVPREHFEEVLDFARIHGFQLTPGAEGLAKEAKDLKESALKVGVAPTRGKMAEESHFIKANREDRAGQTTKENHRKKASQQEGANLMQAVRG